VTAPNPFVFAAEAPVTFFAWLGYALFLISLSFLSTAYCLRVLAELYRDLAQNSEWPVDLTIPTNPSSRWKWVPPVGWTLRAASVPFVFAIVSWAIGGLIFLVGP